MRHRVAGFPSIGSIVACPHRWAVQRGGGHSALLSRPAGRLLLQLRSPPLTWQSHSRVEPVREEHRYTCHLTVAAQPGPAEHAQPPPSR